MSGNVIQAPFYNSGFYNTGAGGSSDDSPDIPEEYKDDYKQLEYIQPRGGASCVFKNINLNSNDIIKFNCIVAEIEDSDTYILSGSTNPNYVSSDSFGFAINSNAYRRYLYWKNNGDANLQYQYPSISLNEKFDIVVNYPNLVSNNVVILNSTTGNVSNIKSISIGIAGIQVCRVGIGKVEILDKDTLERKFFVIPCKNKNNGKNGWFNYMDNSFVGNSVNYGELLEITSE